MVTKNKNPKRHWGFVSHDNLFCIFTPARNEIRFKSVVSCGYTPNSEFWLDLSLLLKTEKNSIELLWVFFRYCKEAVNSLPVSSKTETGFKPPIITAPEPPKNIAPVIAKKSKIYSLC